MILFFSILAALAAVVILLTQELPDGAGMATISTIDEMTVAELRILESRLIKIRSTKKPLGWYDRQRRLFIPSIRPDWQQRAVIATPLAFELLCIEVWGSRGEQYAKYRADNSDMRNEIAPRYIFSKSKPLHYATNI